MNKLPATLITFALICCGGLTYGKNTSSFKDKSMNTYQTKNISVTIRRPSEEVYNFASNPENLPQWAAGLADSSLKKSGAEWVTNSPMGQVKIKFVEKNSFGIIDHDVTLPNGELNHNPMRVVKNGEGSEVIFTIFRRPPMTEEAFNKDSEAVKKDLQKLKAVLEK